MAFCKQCGTKLADNALYCITCGAAVAEGGSHTAGVSIAAVGASNPRTSGAAAVAERVVETAVPPRAPQPTVAPRPAPAPVAIAPTKKSGGALKLLLIMVSALVLAAILIAGFFGYGFYKAKRALNVAVTSENAAGAASSTSTAATAPAASGASPTAPSGANATAAGADQQAAVKLASAMGIELYPGATARAGANGAEFISADPINKVAQFYVNKYPNAVFTSTDVNVAALYVANAGGGVTITVAAGENGDTTKITLSPSSGAPSQ
jgi:zinc-ribbon domain